ncbi:hypothetical protein SAY86_026186 [Trapa natans]|uniref:H15 domain-containing protein n=1 Tax=Trapa natans TaxID=22666 RepID=A0AAN7KJD0_TRANT|nr:hypothetical protein SAY86_026186 [Trapa natans]
MGTEEPADTAAEATTPPPAGTKQHNYPEMIMAAIESLNDKDGSSKEAISDYIEASYSDLSPAHSRLLTHSLDQMTRSGEIFLVKNNYMRSDPDAPPKRGRGRPPKPKEVRATEAATSSPRPRGRPPKPKEPPTSEAATSSPRPRGRPPKAKEPTAPEAATSSPRPRGRPPKPKEPPAPEAATSSPRPRGRPPKPMEKPASGKKRGRPRKKPKVETAPTATEGTAVKRGRGRPPKVKVKPADRSVNSDG